MPLTLSAFWKFTRPHTLYGTAISLLGVYLLFCAETGSNFVQGLTALLVAEGSCLCANVYIVGLNQLTDVAIRINKPYLPVASGEITERTGAVLVSVLLAVALVVAGWANRFLLATVAMSALIGTAYSLPPLRLKRFALFASLCIFSVRGLIVNLGIWCYLLEWTGRPIVLAPSILILSLFVTLFTFVIAIFKDIPDTEGDSRYLISTFSVQLGRRFIFNLSSLLLVGNYLLAVLLAAFVLKPAGLFFLGTAHAVLAAFFLYRRRQVNLKDNQAVADLYQFIWKLFYLAYLIFPLAWWLGHSVGFPA